MEHKVKYVTTITPLYDDEESFQKCIEKRFDRPMFKKHSILDAQKCEMTNGMLKHLLDALHKYNNELEIINLQCNFLTENGYISLLKLAQLPKVKLIILLGNPFNSLALYSKIKGDLDFEKKVVFIQPEYFETSHLTDIFSEQVVETHCSFFKGEHASMLEPENFTTDLKRSALENFNKILGKKD